MKAKGLILGVILTIFLMPYLAFAEPLAQDSAKRKILENARNFLLEQKPLLAYVDAPFLKLSKNKFSGADWEDLILNLFYPTSGRTKYVQYIPRFGKNKMYYRKLEWKRFETDHIDLFVYDPQLKDLFISLVEETYGDLAKTFATESFDFKLRIYIYRDRRDFSQMNFDGIDPSGILGVTHDLRKWKNKIAFLFEGSKSELFAVAQHEMVHRFNMEQIYHQTGQDMLFNPPLWFIEGLAQSYSIYWDATLEEVARDGYYNDFLEYGILPEGRGTFLPYVTGTMIVNYIREKYGTDTINEIIKDASEFAGDKLPKDDKFDEILKKYTGLDTQGLYEKAVEKFGKRLEKSREDIDIKSPIIAKGDVLAIKKKAFLRMEGKYLRKQLYLSKIENGEIVKSKKLATDGKNKTEHLKHAAALSPTHLAYVTFKSSKGTDVLRIATYSIEDEKIKVGKYKEYSHPEILFITSPVFIGEDKIAFVGLKDGFTNIYLRDLKTNKLSQLTKGTSHIAGIDYSAEKNAIVFSRESKERINKSTKCDFNYDLYLLNLETLKETKVVETPYDEIQPQWLNKDQIIFTTDESGTYGLSIYDLKAQRFISVGSVRITASKPKVLNENTIIFHSTKYLASGAHLLKLSSIPSETQNNIKENKTLNHTEKIIGNIVIKDEKLFVTNGKNLFPVKRFAVLGSDLYFDVEVEPGKIKLVQFTNEKSMSSAEKKSADLDKFHDENAVMWEGVSSSGNFAVFVVNNRLNWKDKKKAEKHPVTVYIYDAQKEKFIKKYDLSLKSNKRLFGFISESSTRGFRSAVFLDNDYLLFNIYDIYDKIALFNLADGVKTHFFTDIESLKISPNKRLLSWVTKEWSKKSKLFVFNTQIGKSTEIGEFEDVKNLHFTGNNELVWNYESGRRRKNLTKHICVWNPKSGLKEIKIDISKKSELSVKKKSIINLTASSHLGAILLVEDKETEKKKLYLAKSPDHAEKNKSPNYAKISKLSVTDASIENLQLLHKDHLFFKAKSNKKIKLYAYDIAREELRERTKPKNVDANNTYLILGTKRQIVVYNTKNYKSKILRKTAGYNLKGNALLFSQWTGTDYDIFEMNLISNQTLNLTQTPQRDETHPYYQNEQIKYSVKPVKKGEKVSYIPSPPPPKYQEGRVAKRKISKLPFDIKTGWGVGSIGFRRKNLYLLGYANVKFYDVFEDGMLDLFYFGTGQSYNTGEVSYIHRPSGNGLRIYYDQYLYDHNIGSDFFHVFRLNKFQRIVLGGGYKFQLLANNFPPDYRGLGNVLRANISYTFDTTHWLLHGPQSGFRLFLSTDVGYNINENALNNLDSNFAWRQYFNIKNIVSFAYRLEGGTSIGIVPTWYGVGGNMTLRGIPFLSVWGNTYALAGAEVRFDILYYAGAVFKEPLTPASYLFLTILPQFGWFADVGTTFYWNPLIKPPYKDINRKITRYVYEKLYYPPHLYWSTGPFMNLPYLPLGMILRFNWSVAGNSKYWNLWFGFNW